MLEIFFKKPLVFFISLVLHLGIFYVFAESNNIFPKSLDNKIGLEHKTNKKIKIQDEIAKKNNLQKLDLKTDLVDRTLVQKALKNEKNKQHKRIARSAKLQKKALEAQIKAKKAEELEKQAQIKAKRLQAEIKIASKKKANLEKIAKEREKKAQNLNNELKKISKKKQELELQVRSTQETVENELQKQDDIAKINDTLIQEQEQLNNQKEKVLDDLSSVYKASILAQVQTNWQTPARFNDNATCNVEIKQDQTGVILDYKVSDCNSVATKQFQDAVETAIKLSSPLPLPPSPKVFDPVIVFEFRK